MTVCMPITDENGLDASVSEHFGRAHAFAVYDPEAETVEIHENDSHHHGGDRSPPNVVAETSADILVCGNLGGKAAERFDALGVDVYRGADGTVRDAIEQLQDDELTPIGPDDDGCDHDGGGQHAHGDGHGHHDSGDRHGRDHDDHQQDP